MVDISGIWQGRLTYPGGIESRIIFKISQTRGGRIFATMLRPDQDDEEIMVKSIVIKDSRIRIDIGAIPASFQGDIWLEKKAIEGCWTQGDESQGLTLHKVEVIRKPLSVLFRIHSESSPSKVCYHDEADETQDKGEAHRGKRTHRAKVDDSSL
jgi:hypothetical protein